MLSDQWTITSKRHRMAEVMAHFSLMAQPSLMYAKSTIPFDILLECELLGETS